MKNIYHNNNYRAVITGIIFTAVIGSLCHFVYEWSGNNKIVGLICATDESTFEHMKLLLTPFFLYTFIERFWFHNRARNYYISKAIGVLAGLILIPLIFYTYTAIAGTNYLVVDIGIFIVSVIISFLTAAYIQNKRLYIKQENLGLLILFSLLLITVLISFIKLS